jgi:hypothetical protein
MTHLLFNITLNWELFFIIRTVISIQLFIENHISLKMYNEFRKKFLFIHNFAHFRENLFLIHIQYLFVWFNSSWIFLKSRETLFTVKKLIINLKNSNLKILILIKSVFSKNFLISRIALLMTNRLRVEWL